MAVSLKEVYYIADLARLQLSDEEAHALAKDMNTILDYIDQLNELDVEGVEPLDHVIDLDQHLRSDEAKQPLNHEQALKNAPDADSDYFRVPKVIG